MWYHHSGNWVNSIRKSLEVGNAYGRGVNVLTTLLDKAPDWGTLMRGKVETGDQYSTQVTNVCIDVTKEPDSG